MAISRLTKRQFNEVTNNWLKYDCDFGHAGKLHQRIGKFFNGPYPKYNRCWLRHQNLKARKEEVKWIRQLKVGDKVYRASAYQLLTVRAIKIEWYRGMDVEYHLSFDELGYLYHEPFDKNCMSVYNPDGEYAQYYSTLVNKKD